MATEQETLDLFEEVDNFIQPKIDKCKCILIVGARNSGKTCLIKYFSGVAFTRDTNEEDLPFLVENTEVVSDTQPEFFRHPKLPIELAILRVNDPNSGQEVTIIEMPSLSSVTSQSPESKDARTLFSNILFNIYIWDTVLSLAKQIHICLVNPYEFITDDHKLTQFFGIWEEMVTKSEEAREKIKQSVSIIFTKPEYEDDKQSLITSLEHLSQAGHEMISQNNTFFDATVENRVFCFLSQDTEQGQGQELLNSIMGTAEYYIAGQESLLSFQWGESFLWHFLKDIKDDEFKQIFALSELLFNKFIEGRYSQNFFDKSLCPIGIATTLGFIKSLPKQSGLKQKENLQAQLKSKVKFESEIFLQSLLSIQNATSKFENYLQLLSNLNNLVLKNSKASMTFEEFTNSALDFFWLTFQIGDSEKKIVSNWLQEKASLWKFPTVFWKLCLRHKQNHQLQAGAHSMEDLGKSMTKKFASLLKNKLTSGIKSYEIFAKVNQMKAITQTPIYNQILQTFGFDEGEGEDQIIEQEDTVVPSDSRIKRWYYKVDENADMYSEIKEKAKKMVIKSNTKSEEVNQREVIKNLFSSIERQQETRNKTLELLAKKFIQFRFLQSALQVYMDLGDSFQLYQFLTEFYFSYLDEEQKEPLFQHMQAQLIPYLEEKSSLYSDSNSANYFFISAQSCYDFLAVKFAESSQEYCQMLEASNQLQLPSDEKVLDSNELARMEKSNQSNQLQFLKFSSFSKAEAIEKIYQRDQRCKKNGPLFAQIRKYLEAAQWESKAK